MLDNTPNQQTKLRTKKWVEINDDSIEHITLIVTLNLEPHHCDYSDAYILVNGTITVLNTGRAAVPNKRKNIINIVFHLLIA